MHVARGVVISSAANTYAYIHRAVVVQPRGCHLIHAAVRATQLKQSHLRHL